MRPLDELNPVCCLDCRLIVAVEEISDDPDVLNDIVDWDLQYGAIATLQLPGGPYEYWARRVLDDLDSEIHRCTRRLVRRINERALCFAAVSLAPDECPDVCLWCGGDLRALGGRSQAPLLICDRDRLAFTGSTLLP